MTLILLSSLKWCSQISETTYMHYNTTRGIIGQDKSNHLCVKQRHSTMEECSLCLGLKPLTSSKHVRCLCTIVTTEYNSHTNLWTRQRYGIITNSKCAWWRLLIKCVAVVVSLICSTYDFLSTSEENNK